MIRYFYHSESDCAFTVDDEREDPDKVVDELCVEVSFDEYRRFAEEENYEPKATGNEPMTEEVIRWTHSSMNTFETCPRMYEGKYVLKNVEDEQGPEAIWGDQVHKALEYRVAESTPLPTNMRQYERYAAAVVSRQGEKILEGKYAINRDLEPVDWRSPECWTRGKIDVLLDNRNVLDILDWKTGKMKSDKSQLKLYGLFGLTHHNLAEKVRAGFVWLKNRVVTPPLVITRDDLPTIADEMEARYIPLEYAHKSGIFQPRPSGLCRGWCPVTTCEHWRPKPPGR